MNADRQTGHRDAWRQRKGAGADLQVPMDRLPDGDVSGEGERAQERFRPGIGGGAMRHWLGVTRSLGVQHRTWAIFAPFRKTADSSGVMGVRQVKQVATGASAMEAPLT